MSKLKATELVISGCKVKFPAKPYRSQVAMMSKIITSIQRSQNSLLESPTGSGKSLALLCASLAWQETEQTRVDAFNNLRAQAEQTQDPTMIDALMALAGPGAQMEEESDFPLVENYGGDGAGFINPVEESIQVFEKDTCGGFFVDPEMDDFVDTDSNRQRKVAQPPKEDSLAYHLPGGDVLVAAAGPHRMRLPKKQSVPKIYFGTRTHKQVSQIIRELKKTGYSRVRMTVLASREHTCIHPTVSKSYNKNQDCQDLMDKNKGGGCRYKHNVKTKLQSYHSLRVQMGHEEAWDLEDMVKVGKKGKFCPYFGVRELRKSAQLIICPYNYLVDPKIRKSMEIDLKNEILVLDEAHNIEDSARDAVSGSFDIEDIVFAMQDCERMVGLKILESTHSGLADFCSRLAQWMKKSIEKKADYSDYNSSSRVWTGTTGIAEWNELVFPPANFETVKRMLEEAIKEQELAMEDQEGNLEEALSPALKKKASDVLSDIFRILDFMYLRDSMYRDDYRMAVVQSQARKKTVGTGWVKKGQSTALVKVIHLHFWCLNPGVCFDELKNSCRSIVLTSGTLSPIVTFASELDVKFPVTLEADHVIDKKQVWVGTLSRGPTGHNLNATYKNTETLAFQDEIGRLVRDVCHRVPHGILVFLPSYKMLDNMCQRWQSTGTWADIQARKTIVCEPKFSDKLDEVMREFYDAVAMNNPGKGSADGISCQDGALFLAVCRGKVSEGLDFADNNARAVVCVGIPFPNVKDSLVDLKRRYNDHKRATQDPNILSGAEWYEIQAFRALNQALGRCIRHRKDWGAILMVDDRYARNEKYVQGLSKWVRKNVSHFSSCSNMFTHLDNFLQSMKSMEEEDELQSQVEEINLACENKHQDSLLDSTSSKDLHETTVDKIESDVSTAWKGLEVSGSSMSNASKVTLAQKLAKLQEFSRYVPNTFGNQFKCNTNLDSNQHLNNGGEHLNGGGGLLNGGSCTDISQGSSDELRTKSRKERKPRNKTKKNEIYSEAKETELTPLEKQQAKRKCRFSDDSSANEDALNSSKARKIDIHLDNSIEVIDIRNDNGNTKKEKVAKRKSKDINSCINNDIEVIDVDIDNEKDTTRDKAKKENILILNGNNLDSNDDIFEKESNSANFEEVVVVSDEEENEISEAIVELENKKRFASQAIFGDESDDLLANFNTDSYNSNANKELSSHNKQKDFVSPQISKKFQPKIQAKEAHAYAETAFDDENDDFLANLEPNSGNSKETRKEKDEVEANTESDKPFEDGNDDFFANLDSLSGNSKTVNHNHEKEFVSPKFSDIKSKEVKSVKEALISHLESSPEDAFRESKKTEESLVNISATDLLKSNMDDIVAEDSRMNSHWSRLIKRRKATKDACNVTNKSTDTHNKSIIPDTPEKDEQFADTSLDWDEDMFKQSDEENTPNTNFHQNKTSTSSKKLSERKTLFKTTKNGPNSTIGAAEINKTDNLTDTSLRSDTKSPADYGETSDTSFGKSKSSKKKKKRTSKDSVLAKMPRLPFCDNSDDDFK